MQQLCSFPVSLLGSVLQRVPQNQKHHLVHSFEWPRGRRCAEWISYPNLLIAGESNKIIFGSKSSLNSHDSYWNKIGKCLGEILRQCEFLRGWPDLGHVTLVFLSHVSKFSNLFTAS